MEFKEGNRRWTVESGISGTGFEVWMIRTPCVCGNALGTDVHGSEVRKPQATCRDMFCKERVDIPDDVWKPALASAKRHSDDAWRRRAVHGGPQGKIPI